MKKLILFLFLSITLISCASKDNNSPISVKDVTQSIWYLESIDGFNLEKEKVQKFTLMFKDNRAAGQAFNNFSTEYTIDNTGNINLSNKMLTTRKAVLSKSLAVLESNYFNQLIKATTWEVNNDKLILSNDKDKLIFSKNK